MSAIKFLALAKKNKKNLKKVLTSKTRNAIMYLQGKEIRSTEVRILTYQAGRSQERPFANRIADNSHQQESINKRVGGG